MNPRLARILIRLYPAPWRHRYAGEFEGHLLSSPAGPRSVANVLWSAIHEHISPIRGPELTPYTSRFHSLCLRAPWAVFGVAPAILLAGAYLVASLILWSGWKIFLPGTNTPFVPVHGVAVAYFGLGRSLYFFAPILIGAAIAVLAARNHLKAWSPCVGMIAVALLGGLASIHAGRSTPGRTEQVYFTLQHSAQQIASGLYSALIVLALTLLPYLLWMIAKRTPAGQRTHQP